MFSLATTPLTELPLLFLGTRESEIGPGIAGFIATFILVVATIFLIRDMGRRIRRVRHQAMLENKIEQESFPQMSEAEEEAQAIYKPGENPLESTEK